MSTISVRPIIEDQTDSPYMDVMYTLEEEEWGNVTDYQEDNLGSEGTLSRSSNHSDLASLATASVDAIEVLAVEYDDHDDYIWVKGKFKACIGCVNNLVTGFVVFCSVGGCVTQFLKRP